MCLNYDTVIYNYISGQYFFNLYFNDLHKLKLKFKTRQSQNF